MTLRKGWRQLGSKLSHWCPLWKRREGRELKWTGSSLFISLAPLLYPQEFLVYKVFWAGHGSLRLSSQLLGNWERRLHASLRTTWASWWVPRQPGLWSETIIHKKKKEERQKEKKEKQKGLEKKEMKNKRKDGKISKFHILNLFWMCKDLEKHLCFF